MSRSAFAAEVSGSARAQFLRTMPGPGFGVQAQPKRKNKGGRQGGSTKAEKEAKAAAAAATAAAAAAESGEESEEESEEEEPRRQLKRLKRCDEERAAAEEKAMAKAE